MNLSKELQDFYEKNKHENCIRNWEETLKKSKGAMYFTDNGKLEIVWEGAKGKGKWKADNKSRFCYTQSLWGGRECITLLRNNEDGGFVHIFDGKKRMLVEGAIEKGRKL